MILVSPTFIATKLGGVFLADSGTIRRGSYSTQFAGTPLVCSYYVRWRKHPKRIFGRTFSVNHSRNRSGKAIDNTQGTRPVRPKLLRGYRSPELQPVPGGPANWAAIQPPLQKRMTRPCALAYSATRAVSVGQCRLNACGEPWTPGPEPTWPRPGLFRRSQLCYPVLASATCGRPLSGALSTRPPNVDGPSAGPDSKK